MHALCILTALIFVLCRLPSARTAWRPSTATVRPSPDVASCCRPSHADGLTSIDKRAWLDCLGAGTVNDKEKKLIADMLPDLKAQVFFYALLHTVEFHIVQRSGWCFVDGPLGEQAAKGVEWAKANSK
jgi:hypothetical protein